MSVGDSVCFMRSSKGKEMAMTFLETDFNKVYLWSNYGVSKKLIGPQTISVICSGCRAIRDAGHHEGQLPMRKYNEGSKRWTNITDHEHICTPKDRTEVSRVNIEQHRLYYEYIMFSIRFWDFLSDEMLKNQ